MSNRIGKNSFFLALFIPFISTANISQEKNNAPQQSDSYYFDGDTRIGIPNNNASINFQENNHLPIINIVIPNKNGISHNKYTEFSVGQSGLYINNIASDNSESAKIIINEVISNQKSLLNGNVTLLGKQAHLIIANPNGITCNGCSFSNTSATTLTTANIEPMRGNNAIEYKVKGGEITFNNINQDHQFSNKTGILRLFAHDITMQTGIMVSPDIFFTVGKNFIQDTNEINNPIVQPYAINQNDEIGYFHIHHGFSLNSQQAILALSNSNFINDGLLNTNNQNIIIKAHHSTITNNQIIVAGQIALRSEKPIFNNQGKIFSIEKNNNTFTLIKNHNVILLPAIQ